MQSYVANQCTGKYEVKLALSISDTHTEKLSNLENHFVFVASLVSIGNYGIK